MYTIYRTVISIVILFVLLFSFVACSQESVYTAYEDALTNDYTFNNQDLSNYFSLYQNKIYYNEVGMGSIEIYCADENGVIQMASSRESRFDVEGIFIHGRVVFSSGKVYISGTCGTEEVFFEYNSKNDEFVEIARIENKNTLKTWTVFNNNIYYLFYEDEFGYYDIKNSALVKISEKTSQFSITPTGQVLYINVIDDSQVNLWKFDAEQNTSNKLYSTTREKSFTLSFSQFSVTENYFIIDDGTNNISVYNINTGEESKLDFSFSIGMWVIYDKSVFITDALTGSIYRYNLVDRDIECVVENLNNVLQIYATNDNTVYVLALEKNNNVYRISVSGEKEKVFSY